VGLTSLSSSYVVVVVVRAVTAAAAVTTGVGVSTGVRVKGGGLTYVVLRRRACARCRRACACCRRRWVLVVTG
jgi:hypothetical protein